MNIKQIKKLKIGTVLEEVNLKNFNTFKVSTTASAVVYPNNID